jgi:two-component system sensor histidine kinase BaeS
MRTRLFLAFFAVILMALVSNFIFEHLIIRDFEEYALGAQEDHLYWVLASVEGSHEGGEWDMGSLRRNMHWAMMLGYDVEVLDMEGKSLLASMDLVASLTPSMRRRMEAIVELESPEGEFEPYPLFIGGKHIGSLMVRRLSPVSILKEKEAMFKRRGRDFLVISFLIAGGGAVFLSLVFSLFLTGPIRRLQQAAEAVASGDLSVRVRKGSGDEIGRLNEAFNHMVETLEREESLRKRLTSNIAHELRTPLAVMKANFEAVADGVMECSRETLDGLGSEVERLISLVEGIEDITKAEESFFERVERTEVDVRLLVEGILQGMSAMFREKGLDIAMANEVPLTVATDPEKLEIILRNIISNSLKHTEKGSVRIGYGLMGGLFFVEVRDTGRGIPEEQQGLVFKRFYKGEDSTGIGLGLAIAKELVDIMGGTIEVESTVGEGSTFRVTLPAGEGD